MQSRYVVCAIIASVSSSSAAEILQWYDGDNNGSLWLSDSTIEPYADLSGQTLWWADLDWANLHHSNLQEANLMYAHLIGANLAHSSLNSVNFYGAILSEANLSFTNLSYANLRFTDVFAANLFSADLTDANLTGMYNWDQAFWLRAFYNQNTIFPTGMDPESFGMILIPAPATLALLSVAVFATRRRRS